MWQPLLKLLSFLGRLRFPALKPSLAITVGNPDTPDHEGGTRWKSFADTESLWQVWGPDAGTPWEPYHCVTLFAALDMAKRRKPQSIGPLPPPEIPDWLKLHAPLPAWSTKPGTMMVIDLPGPRSVSAAFFLAAKGGFQTVCTFDNWPNSAAGVLYPERVLGTLLYYASALADRRTHIPRTASPIWICDRDRTDAPRPAPGRYDNRYIIEDRLLPGPRILRAAGIHSLVYIRESASRSLSPDLGPYLAEVFSQGFNCFTVAVDAAEAFANAEPLVPPPPTGGLSAAAAVSGTLTVMGLMRSSAGGFGGHVPHPSSGG